jgi:hypothetical protein
LSTPKWTVLYNGAAFRCYRFFDSKEDASTFYERKSVEGLVPTMRPYHERDHNHCEREGSAT